MSDVPTHQLIDTGWSLRRDGRGTLRDGGAKHAGPKQNNDVEITWDKRAGE